MIVKFLDRALSSRGDYLRALDSLADSNSKKQVISGLWTVFDFLVKQANPRNTDCSRDSRVVVDLPGRASNFRDTVLIPLCSLIAA